MIPTHAVQPCKTDSHGTEGDCFTLLFLGSLFQAGSVAPADKGNKHLPTKWHKEKRQKKTMQAVKTLLTSIKEKGASRA